MNRETWRAIKRLTWQEADRVLHEIYDPQFDKAKHYVAKSIFACVFTALHDRFPQLITGDVLHSIAVDAVALNDGVDTPEELIDRLARETGFDIRLSTDEQPNTYIPKEAEHGQTGDH